MVRRARFGYLPVMSRFGKRPDMIVHESEPFNAEPPGPALLAETLTPLDSFYVRGHGAVPEIDAGDWRLAVAGLCGSPLRLGLEDLRGRFREREVVATLQCAGNRRAGLIEVEDIPGEAPWGPGATGTARWTGVYLADLLVAAEVDARARHVAFVGVDRAEEAEPPQAYGASIPLQKAMSHEVLVAWAMNGEPLPPVHGAPLRMIVPGYVGARSVKWLERIEIRADPWDGYFQETSYRLLAPGQEEGPGEGMALGEVALNSDILCPPDRSTVPPGGITVEGYAFAGGSRRVARVDVSTDGGGSWRQAELDEDLGPWAWRTWRLAVELGPGEHELLCRAWDSAANLQPERPDSVWNPKGYVNSSWGRARVSAIAQGAGGPGDGASHPELRRRVAEAP